MFSFSYIGQGTDWTLANGFLNLELFFSYKVHLLEKGNLKLSKSIRKNTDGFCDTGYINHNQFSKMAVSFVLSYADFPPLPTVYKLHSTYINAFPDKHISNATTVTRFSKTVFTISKNFVAEDKLVL